MRKFSRYLRSFILILLPVLLFGIIKILAEKKEQDAVDTQVQEAVRHDYQHQHYHRRNVVKSKLDIEIHPLLTALRPTRFIGYEEKQENVLVLPIKVVNKSQQTLKTTIAYEYNSSLGMMTDLHVFMWDSKKPTIRRVLLLRKKGDITRPSILHPGASTTLNLRMDWPGADAVSRATGKEDLMPLDTSATYTLHIILFFKSGGQQQYVISPKMRISVVVPEDE